MGIVKSKQPLARCCPALPISVAQTGGHVGWAEGGSGDKRT